MRLYSHLFLPKMAVQQVEKFAYRCVCHLTSHAHVLYTCIWFTKPSTTTFHYDRNSSRRFYKICNAVYLIIFHISDRIRETTPSNNNATRADPFRTNISVNESLPKRNWPKFAHYERCNNLYRLILILCRVILALIYTGVIICITLLESKCQ